MCRPSFRVLIDVNVWISYFLSAGSPSTPKTIVEAGLRRDYTLLMTDVLIDDMTRILRSKPYLINRIPPEALDRLVAWLADVAEHVPPINHRLERVVRDPKDDYLLAYARAGNADYLVSGDRDLLALAESIDAPRIVSPAEFLTLLG